MPEPHERPPANDRLRSARLSRPSSAVPGEPMSRSELADAVNDHLWRVTGRVHALDAHTIARYERGAVRWPGREYRAALRTVLGLASDADLGFRPTQRGRPTTAVADMVDDGDVDRRRFLAAIGLAAATASIESAALDPGRLASTRIGQTDVAALRRSVRLMASQTQLVGGGSLHSAATATYRQVRRLIDESQHSNAVGRDLVSVAGEFATCAGWMAYDIGDQRSARELFADAVVLAGQIGDQAGTIRALNAMTLQAAHRADAGKRPGPARESLRLAERLVDLARAERSPRMHALVVGHEVVARALTGDDAGFGRALTRAWRAADHLTPADDEPEWLRFVDPAAVATFIARGHRYRGEHATAVDLLHEHCRTHDVSPWNRANYRAQLAAVLAEAGDTTRAVDMGRSVVEDMTRSAISSPRTLALLEPVRRADQTSLGGSAAFT